MERIWTYEGNIGAVSFRKNCRGETIIDLVELDDLDDYRKAPILLHCSACFFAYIDDLEGHDDEERYMRKRFTFDATLTIRMIEVLNTDGQVCKIVSEESERDWLARVTGPMERISNRKQPPLPIFGREVHIMSGKIERSDAK